MIKVVNFSDSDLKLGRFLLFAAYWGAISSVVALALIKVGVRGQYVFAIKDLPIYFGSLVFARYWLMREVPFKSVFLLLGFFLFLLLNYILLNPDYQAPLNNLRQIVGPLYLVLIFSSMRISRRRLDSLVGYFCILVVSVFLLGLVEQLAELWPSIDLTEFFNEKGIPTDESGVSYMFYEPLLGYRERMTSIFIDPISLGHFFASFCIFIYYLRSAPGWSRYVFFLSFVGLVLTFSKGAMLQCFIGLILLNPRVLFGLKLVLAMAVAGAVMSLPDAEGIAIHVNGFLNSIQTLSLFGYGIGSSGNYAKMFSGDLSMYYKLAISDTFVGALIGQAGVVGLIAWLGLGCYFVVANAKSREAGIAGMRLFLSIFSVSVLSENTMNVTSFLVPSTLMCLAMAGAEKEGVIVGRKRGGANVREPRNQVFKKV